jgi:hypothetical protein
MTEALTLIATSLIGIAGLYLAHSWRRRSQVELAEARRSAYAALWQITATAAPTRLRPDGAGTLTTKERKLLFERMTIWYYTDGQGMFLASETREVYLAAKHNLTCPDEKLKPNGVGLLARFPAHLTTEQKRGCLSIRQLSLLRTQMKSDLAVYGKPYQGTLRVHEREFLEACDISMRRRPWRTATRGEPSPEPCEG